MAALPTIVLTPRQGLSTLPVVLKLPPRRPAMRDRTAGGDACRRLDKHYIPARYPNGFDSGYPGKLYTEGEAKGAIEDAEAIRAFCRGNLSESG